MSEEIKGMLNALIEGQQVTNAKLEAMEKRMGSMEKRMESIEKQMDSIEGDIKDLKTGQDRQIRILEKLSLRSLEQETEIDALKRAE